MLAIMQRHLDQTKEKCLPIIYPLIIYAGKKKYKYSTSLYDLFGDQKDLAQEILSKPYQLINLMEIPDGDLERQTWFGTMALLMKHISAKNIMIAFKKVVDQLRVIEISGDNDYVYTTLSYAVQSGQITDPEEFQQIIRTGLSKKSEETYMTLADIFRREGRQQALEEVHILAEKIEQEGRQETVSVIAKNLLQQGMSIEQIMLVTGLSILQIKNLQLQKNKSS